MRNIIKNFVAFCSNNIDFPEPIYEFGSLQIENDKFSNLRPLFANKNYIGADMREGPGVDKILDLHRIDLPDSSVGTILCLDTFEHVEFPRKAIEEIHRVLKSDGYLILSSVMNFPIHGYPSDYWRYTPSAFDSLLKIFDDSMVFSAGISDFPHTVIGIASKNKINSDIKSSIKEFVKIWTKKYSNPFTGNIKSKLKLFIPPIIVYYKKMLFKKNKID